MKLANIVTTTNVSVSKDFNVVKSLDETIQGLPTLIIGWDHVKKNYDNYDISNRILAPNLYWTFKKTEKRDLHEEDIYNFTQLIYNNLVKDINYVFIDPIITKKRVIKKILKKIQATEDIVSYHHNDMIYMYGDKIIFGIDLNLIEFIGLNVDRVLSKIKSKSKDFLTKNTIFIEYKSRVENLDNQAKYLPYLYSIENG